MLIDTHCHLHDREWFAPEQQAEFLESAHNRGIEKIICIGANPEDSKNACNFAANHKNVYWTYGIHPEFADGLSDVLSASKQLIAELSQVTTENAGRVTPATAGWRDDRSSSNCLLTDSAAPVAIGEIGLDYHYDGYDRTAQIKLFEQMLQLALDLNLPVSLHLREAFADAFAVLDNFSQIQGVIHSFTGSKRDLKAALSRGFYIGVNGLATYTTPPLPPLERIVLETDAPFLTPVPMRGKINQPGYVAYVATYLADKLGIKSSIIREETTKNARKIFQI